MVANEPAATSAPSERLLWPEEVAALRGVATRTVIQKASRSRRLQELGRLTRYDLPVPRDEDRLRRPVRRNDGRMVAVESPRWREPVIRAWLDALAEGRPAPERDREEGTGRYRTAS